MTTPKRKSKIRRIEQDGVRIRLFMRGDWHWFDLHLDGERRRRSAGTLDAVQAEANARALARELATQRLLGVTPDTLTLAQLFTAYFEHKGRHLKGQRKRAAETRGRLFRQSWGDHTLVSAISQSSVDRYCADRRSGRVAPTRLLADGSVRMTNGARVRFGGKMLAALDADFRWLSSVFNWAVKDKLPSGKRLLQHNPLHDLKKDWKPKEKRPRRPLASKARYVATLPHCDTIDPSGRLRCILAFARWTGRRESAILKLRAHDVLLGRASIRAALAAAGEDESRGDGWAADGAVRWSAENDKQGVQHFAKMSRPLRAELDRYLARNPRLGDTPLFPAPEDAGAPLRRDVASRWLMKAERLAGEPKIAGGIWHPYRRLWATELMEAGVPDTVVAKTGGWANTQALRASYQDARQDEQDRAVDLVAARAAS